MRLFVALLEQLGLVQACVASKLHLSCPSMAPMGTWTPQELHKWQQLLLSSPCSLRSFEEKGRHRFSNWYTPSMIFLFLSDFCNRALGAAAGGALEDAAFTASSSYDEASVGPKNARWSLISTFVCPNKIRRFLGQMSKSDKLCCSLIRNRRRISACKNVNRLRLLFVKDFFDYTVGSWPEKAQNGPKNNQYSWIVKQIL